MSASDDYPNLTWANFRAMRSEIDRLRAELAVRPRGFMLSMVPPLRIGEWDQRRAPQAVDFIEVERADGVVLRVEGGKLTAEKLYR